MAIATTTRRLPQTVTSFGGRVFYAADSYIYYSQIVTDDFGVLGRCYQVNDPTSDHIPDLLATDGGELEIKDSRGIFKLVPFRKGVLAFAKNGLWYLYGAERGFDATNFNVDKVTSYAMVSSNAYAVIGDVVLFAGKDGIHQVASNEYGTLASSSLTDTTIKSAYQDFLVGDVSATYLEKDKQVWWFNSDKKSLVFDLRAGAWYPQEFASKNHITAIDLDEVELEPLFFTASDSGVLGFNRPTSDVFKDYGVDTEAYLLSSFETLGEFSNKKGATYGSFFFNKTETEITGFDVPTQSYNFDFPSGCLLQVRWDFDGSNAYHKWTGDLEDGDVEQRGIVMQLYKPMQRGFLPDAYPYNFDTGETLVNKKVKLRGNGKAVQFMFKAETNKDMQMLGYSIDYSMRGRK